jgi:tRNAThr (cytosine32-N3)-methyltransferase
MTSDPAIRRALAAIDQAHEADPKGRELVYVASIQDWIGKLVTQPSDALLLAARCQHLERWTIKRDEFPIDRPGYHQWRRAVQVRQGQRATELLKTAGCDDALAQRVAMLISKTAPKGDADGQALEDAACLVFLQDELAAFAAEHGDYTREKFIDIIRRSWNKMSPKGHELALAIPLSPDLSALVKAAISN